ncbi:hypothetical protein FisN_33Lh051 [Fistulifera solaris]|uniref:Uncharacterized protein n=1 Tax=Fistulifera solaris TaxID=1519565 RepID=A0A1Z5KB44_FISSO|nr:hypothetical protein FisN_33Lh051 [Fistulifera solaris]|eukprot:GAX23158.1 hypothetical protein FisN_33Lh051 [Fistulifera solaris]
MAKLAAVLFSRKRKRDTEEYEKENKKHASDDTVTITTVGESPRYELTKRSKTIRFSTVHIHEHLLVLGDNPAVSRGVPLTLAWESCYSKVYSIEEYEKRRQPKRRQNSLPSAYTPQQREAIAKLNGSSKKAIQSAGVHVKEIQQSREEAEWDTVKRGMWERLRQTPAIVARFRL